MGMKQLKIYTFSLKQTRGRLIEESTDVGRFLKKLNIELPYDTAIPLLGVYPKKTIIKKDTETLIFIAALFTIARTRKQLKSPSTDEWIKMWYIYTMECYSAIKRNKCESVELKWMNLEPVVQSEVKSEKEKQTLCINTI